MRTNKWIALALALVMTICALPLNLAAAEDPITLVCYSQLANWNGELTGWFAKLLLDKFNVKIIVVPDADGVYATRVESGNLGDLVVWGGDGEDYLNAVNQGLLFDWEDEDLLAEYGPYILEHMPAALEKNRALSGGTVYGFGHNVATNANDHDIFFYNWDLRYDLYQQLGYPELTDLNSFVDMLVKMKELCPTDDNGNETFAVSLWPDWDGDMVMYVKSTATAYYGYDELGVGLYDPQTGVFHPCLDKDGPYIEMVRFYYTLNKLGLLDPNSMVNTYDTMIERVRNGGTFFSIFNYSGSDGYNNEEHIAANKIMLPVMPSQATPIVYGMRVMGGNYVWSIGAKSMYPEICMEIINWLCTPEGRLTSDYGPRGLCWDYDENGLTYFTELGKLCKNNRKTDLTKETNGEWNGLFGDGSNQINCTTWSTGATNPESGEAYNSDLWASNQTAARNAAEQDWRDRTGANGVQDYMNKQSYVVSPGTSYSVSAKSDTLKITWAQVTKCIRDLTWNAIYAKNDGEFEYLINEMARRAKAYGYDDCVAWCQNEAAIRYALELEATGGK